MKMPEPYQREIYATSANTEAVRKGFEMGGYVKKPNLYTEDQMRQYGRDLLEAAINSYSPDDTATDYINKLIDMKEAL